MREGGREARRVNKLGEGGREGYRMRRKGAVR